MTDQKKTSSHEDALQILVDAKILNPNITLSQMIEVHKRIEASSAGDGAAYAWAFCVKGKFCYKDDSPSQSRNLSDATWPSE